MSVADWVIVLAIAGSAMVAASQGLFFELFSLAGVAVGYLLAVWQYHALAGWFAGYVKSGWVADIAGFTTIFLAVVILAGIAGRIARWLLKEAGLSWFDRILGGMFGVLRGCLMVAVILLGMTSFAPSSKLLTRSQLAPYFLVIGRAAIWVAPGELRARFYQGLDLLRRAQSSPPAVPPAH